LRTTKRVGQRALQVAGSSARPPTRWPRRLSCTARSLRSVRRTARAPSAR